MKMAPIIKELEKNDEDVCIVHTGQHYDDNMSVNILKDLEIRDPDYHLGMMSGTHAEQTAKIMIEFEKICIKLLPIIFNYLDKNYKTHSEIGEYLILKRNM